MSCLRIIKGYIQNFDTKIYILFDSYSLIVGERDISVIKKEKGDEVCQSSLNYLLFL